MMQLPNFLKPGTFKQAGLCESSHVYFAAPVALDQAEISPVSNPFMKR